MTKEGEPLSGLLYMIIAVFVTLYIPLFILLPFIIGIIGGYKVGDMKKAIGTAIIPSIILAVCLLLNIGYLVSVQKAFIGGSTIFIAAINSFMIFPGAMTGGIIS